MAYICHSNQYQYRLFDFYDFDFLVRRNWYLLERVISTIRQHLLEWVSYEGNEQVNTEKAKRS